VRLETPSEHYGVVGALVETLGAQVSTGDLTPFRLSVTLWVT